MNKKEKKRLDLEMAKQAARDRMTYLGAPTREQLKAAKMEIEAKKFAARIALIQQGKSPTGSAA